MGSRYNESQSAYREVQQRHADVQRIERTITELAQLFNDVRSNILQLLHKLTNLLFCRWASWLSNRVRLSWTLSNLPPQWKRIPKLGKVVLSLLFSLRLSVVIVSPTRTKREILLVRHGRSAGFASLLFSSYSSSWPLLLLSWWPTMSTIGTSLIFDYDTPVFFFSLFRSFNTSLQSNITHYKSLVSPASWNA